MEFAITLVAPPGSGGLLELSRSVSAMLGHKAEPVWLAEGEAVDLVFEGQADRQTRPALKERIGEKVRSLPVDWCLQPARHRRKRMLIADMDSTIIGQECLDEMADLLGIKAEVAAITDRSMRGELDFETGLRARISLLKGLSESDLRRVLERRITINPGAKTLVETMKAHGAHTVLVSGGFTFFTGAVAERVGFTAHRGNRFLWEDGKLAGVAEPILGREAKLEALKEESAAYGIAPEETVAVGDGANDLAMLREAGLGVAYRAKPVVAAEADAQINSTALTTLLYFQGYSRAEFLEC